MTRTHFTLDDLGYSLSPRALLNFLRYLPPQAESVKAQSDKAHEIGEWSDVKLTPQLLASLVDVANMICWEIAQVNSKRNLRTKMPEPIHRPGIKDRRKRFGSEPIKVKDFAKWWNGGANNGKH